MKTLEKLTPEKFADIYKDEKFRNEVAFAHAYCNTQGVEQHRKTCSYPKEYIVTDDQIAEATKELERAKKETLTKYANTLLFVGMGMTYEPKYKDDICNHRIRTTFKNAFGNVYFVEFGTLADYTTIRCDHSIDETLRETLPSVEEYKAYNFGKLERRTNLPKYTKTNILNLVNRVFNCKFTDIVIDNYNIHPDDQKIICESPKQ